MGLGGIAYVVIIGRRMRAQTAYRPVFEDWLFHALLPLVAYALLLLFIGIHNAWDTVTHLVFVREHELLEDEGDS